MAEFSTITTYEVKCPDCDSAHVVKDGKQSGQQRYLCRGCKKKFRANGKAQGRRMDAELMGSAIRDFYSGKSYKQIAEGLKDEYDIPEPSKATIYEWVRDYTDEAKELTADMKTPGRRRMGSRRNGCQGRRPADVEFQRNGHQDPLHSCVSPI